MGKVNDGSGAGTRMPGLDQAVDRGADFLLTEAGRSPVLDEAQLGVLCAYGTQRDVAAGDVLFAAGDETRDLIVILEGTAEIVHGYGQAGARVIATFGPSEFLGEIALLTGQRAYLTAVATARGRVLAVPVGQVRVVIAEEPSLSDLLLRTFLVRHSNLMRRGVGLTLIGSVFDPDTRRLLEHWRAPGWCGCGWTWRPRPRQRRFSRA
jgi:thioredoxin reductase (NADPH)